MSDAHGSGTLPDSTAVDDGHAAAHESDRAHRSEVPAAAAGEVSSAREDRSDADPADGPDEGLAAMVEQPAKVMRIGTMIKQLLEEVRAAPLDEAGRRKLAEIHASSIRELESGLAPELREELDRLTLPFATDAGDDRVPSEPELRIAQAQLVGWLEGLFHGIQTALVAQQMAARQQLEEMRRRALPGGSGGPGGPGQQALVVGPGGQILGVAPGHDEPGHGTGQYL